MLAKNLPTSPTNGADGIAVLERRLPELRTQRKAITETIIKVDATVGAAPDNHLADLQQAEAVLNGEKFVASRERPVSQLAALYAEREVIDRALEIGDARLHRMAAERASEIWARHSGEIAEIELKRVMLAIELQVTNRKREALRRKLTEAGGSGYLSTDGMELLGFVDVGSFETWVAKRSLAKVMGASDEVAWAAARLVADGIATQQELEKAMRDG